MGYYLPSPRVLNSTMVQQILKGEKRLLKKCEVIHTGIVLKLPSFAKDKLVARFPLADTLRNFLPDDVPLSYVDHRYLLNVG